MDSLHSGSNELIFISTDKLNFSIKGKFPINSNLINQDCPSQIKIYCQDNYDLLINDKPVPSMKITTAGLYKGIVSIPPLFFEQQRYELIIESISGETISFWHDNLNIRNKITNVGNHNNLLSGVLNFGNEIGYSDLIIKLNGEEYLRLVIEVYPSKISYKEDYTAIISDITKELYNIAFDFLKKTYIGYKQNDTTNSSPVEFFTIIEKIFNDLLKSIDMILLQPQHTLEKTYEVTSGYKIKKYDYKTIHWIQNHPNNISTNNGNFYIDKALSIKKQVTYDTKENRMTKYIIITTIKKLEYFKKNYALLQREADPHIIEVIDYMIYELTRRSNSSILKYIKTTEKFFDISLVFSMAVGYKDLYKYYLMLLRGLSIHGDIFNISIKDLSVLYEYWCFIKLNSLMKTRYQLVSQDIIKVQSNGLFFSLVKGQGSRVKYKNPETGEIILLSYNPKTIDVPTVTQRPDNVLTLEKKGSSVQYEYVFDAKYRINAANPESDYYNTISTTPGPEVSDINTMHRYRDAIVSQHDTLPYRRNMFGAYVLFPYSDEAEYSKHRFYTSIDKVNIGGLPFLPSSTKLVTKLLDELISDSADSAFERTSLPKGIEEKLAKIDWSTRDVMVGSLNNKEQLQECLKYKTYVIESHYIQESDLPIRYVALYQPKNSFGSNSGIEYYGEVIKCFTAKKNIHKMHVDSNVVYYWFMVKEWKKLSKPIFAKELGRNRFYTNLFLLEHSSEIPELFIKTEEEYRLYHELKRTIQSTEINDDDIPGLKYNDYYLRFFDGFIYIYKYNKIINKYSIKDFIKHPNSIFRNILDVTKKTHP